MKNIFIGWSGNQQLANEVAKELNARAHDEVIVGGGQPKDMFIGAQVIDQINRCDTAVLLVEDVRSTISPNLMFEWGYIVAKFPIGSIHAFLLNKLSKDLPSDLLGSWVKELSYEKDDDGVRAVAQKIADLFIQDTSHVPVKNYFDIISNWKQIYAYLSDTMPESNQVICEYILAGCLAAYYYQDNKLLRQTLKSIRVPAEIYNVVQFARVYVDMFLKSENMTLPLSQKDFFNCTQTFDTVLKRKKTLSADVEMLLDILSYESYGLACLLFMKNKNLDEGTKTFCAERARTNYEKDFELLEQFENLYPNNVCLMKLLKGYIYNDFGHLYRDYFHDDEKFLECLMISVEERKSLYQTFVATYPNNSFLATKLEQEYIIALSEQCNYMKDSILRAMYQNSVIEKFEEWKKELVYTSSLTDRIKQNIEKFK